MFAHVGGAGLDPDGAVLNRGCQVFCVNSLAICWFLVGGYAVGVGGGELVEGSFPALDGGGV